MAANPVPEGCRTLTPYLVVHNTAEAIDWYQRAFGAVETFRMNGPGGSVVHAEIRIGDSMLMLSDESPRHPELKSPKTARTTTGGIMVYVPNVDELFARAVKAGATVRQQVADMFWGDRMGNLADPFGHFWSIATHKEDLTQEQIEERARSLYAKGAGQ